VRKDNTSIAKAAADQLRHFDKHLGKRVNKLVQGRDLTHFHLRLLPTLVELVKRSRLDNCDIRHEQNSKLFIL